MTIALMLVDFPVPLSFAECSCILHQLLFLQLIADQIIQHDCIHIIDRQEINGSVVFSADPECLVESEHAHTVILVESGHMRKEFINVFRILQLFT